MRAFDILAFAVVPMAIVLLLGTYAISPEFYLRHILRARGREQLLVERVTFVAALTASVMLLWVARRFWTLRSRRGDSDDDGGTPLRGRGAAGVTFLAAMACVVFAGEEVDWGQTVFAWKTPEPFRRINNVTSLHNAPGIPFRLLADLFIFGMFVALPLAWHWRLSRAAALRDLRWVIPEAAVASSIVIASLWRWVRRLYDALAGDSGNVSAGFGAAFLGQIGEQREMLTAMALLIYAIYRVRAARSLSFAVAQTSQ